MLHLRTIIGNRDINIEHKLCKNDTVLQIIATRAVQAFLIVLQNEKFTIPSNVQAETKRYFMESSNVVAFCEYYPISNFIGKTQYYSLYLDYCSENNETPMVNAQFGKKVLALGYRSERYSFDGNRNTYYVHPSFSNDSKDLIYTAYRTAQNENGKGIFNFETYLSTLVTDEQETQDIGFNNTSNNNNLIEGQISFDEITDNFLENKELDT